MKTRLALLPLIAAFILGTGTAAFAAAAETGAVETGAAGTVPDKLDTPAQAAVKKLPREVVNAPNPRRFATRDSRNEEISSAVQMEEIRVYGQVDPEDYAKRTTALQQFHNRLENDRPMTPKEKTQAALCFIGLCGIYGPDGLPREPSLDERSAARTNLSTIQLSTQFRGTLQ